MRREQLVRWLATLLPQPIAQAPERVCLNFACLVIGLSAVLDHPPDFWAASFGMAWGAVMSCGAAFALVGYWNNPRRSWANSVERLGYGLVLIAAATFSVSVLVAIGFWGGIRVWVIFAAIAAAKVIRLLITSAYRSYILRSGDHGDPP